MADTVKYRFVLRRGLAADWTAQNPIILEGEFGLELDTKKIKVGDGTTAWNTLAYFQAIDLPAVIHAATAKTTPVNSDELGITDSAASFGLKKLTWGDLKATLKAYFDTIYTGGGGGSGQYSYADPAFSAVSSLMHFEGTNGSTTITDQVSGNVWTANGGAAISTASFAQGASSLKIAASGNSCISMPTSSKYNVGSGDWTLQFTFNPIGTPQTSARLFHTRDGDTYPGIGVDINVSGGPYDLRLYLSSSGASFDQVNGALIANLSATTPSEILIQRRGLALFCVVNGFVVWTGQMTNNTALYYNASDIIIIGGNKTGTSRSANAYIDEFRFTKGVALLVPNRTYPVQPTFPDS